MNYVLQEGFLHLRKIHIIENICLKLILTPKNYFSYQIHKLFTVFIHQQKALITFTDLTKDMYP
jgi:hypothetical protein